MGNLYKRKRKTLQGCLNGNNTIIKSRLELYTKSEINHLRKLLYNRYSLIKKVVKTTKRLPQKQYTTNLDVCNID